MLKRLSALVLALVLALSVCSCADEARVCWAPNDCAIVEPVGFFELDKKRADVAYELQVGSVVWCVIAPVIGTVISGGFYLWEPVGPKREGKLHNVLPDPHGPKAKVPLKEQPAVKPESVEDVVGGR